MMAYNQLHCQLAVVFLTSGSILGQLLFIITMNDIGNVSEFLYTILYADDTCVLLNGSGVVVVERLEQSLQFLFSRVERRSSSCFTCFLSILQISCRNYHST